MNVIIQLIVILQNPREFGVCDLEGVDNVHLVGKFITKRVRSIRQFRFSLLSLRSAPVGNRTQRFLTEFGLQCNLSYNERTARLTVRCNQLRERREKVWYSLPCGVVSPRDAPFHAQATWARGWAIKPLVRPSTTFLPRIAIRELILTCINICAVGIRGLVKFDASSFKTLTKPRSAPLNSSAPNCANVSPFRSLTWINVNRASIQMLRWMMVCGHAHSDSSHPIHWIEGLTTQRQRPHDLYGSGVGR